MGPARGGSAAPAGRAAGLRALLRPAWTRLAARVPALARLREGLAPSATAPPPPIPRAAIHEMFAAMLEPAWVAIDTPAGPPKAVPTG